MRRSVSNVSDDLNAAIPREPAPAPKKARAPKAGERTRAPLGPGLEGLTVVGSRPHSFNLKPKPQGLGHIDTLDRAYKLALSTPVWLSGDQVEVSWSGDKGYEGSWAAGTVVHVDDIEEGTVLVRFSEFCDTDGSPLVEPIPAYRIRLPQPPRPENWCPAVGETIEALWKDCWWEGTVREFHVFKGVLFQYAKYANWVWLPLRCTRPLLPPHLFFPAGREATSSGPSEGDGSDEVGTSDDATFKRCGALGCSDSASSVGLDGPAWCNVKVAKGSRVQVLKARSELEQQQELYHDIQQKRHVREKVASARANALIRAEQRGASIKAAKHAEQWHANFRIDEFDSRCRDICVLQPPHESSANGAAREGAAAPAEVRGVLVLGPGHTLADTRKMLLTEFQLRPASGSWMLQVVEPSTRAVFTDLTCVATEVEILSLLPPGPCALLVGNCMPPRAVEHIVL
jgi:hypothetical protein